MRKANWCTACDDLRSSLAVGQTAECACGQIHANYAVRVVRRSVERTEAHALDALLRDGPVLAAWLACSSVQAIDLDPEARRHTDDQRTEQVARIESRVERGRQLERVLHTCAPDVQAIVLWVALRGADKRAKHDRFGRFQHWVPVGEAYANDSAGKVLWAKWHAQSGARGQARAWGDGELQRAAMAWVAAKQEAEAA